MVDRSASHSRSRMGFRGVTMQSAMLTVRTPTLVDVSAMARVHNDGWRDTYGDWLPPKFYNTDALTRREAMWGSLIWQTPAGADIRVAELNGVIVGLGAAGPSRDAQAPASAQLFGLYVTRTAQHNGVGSALLTAVIGDAAAHCWVASQNHRAIGFYRHHGFEPTGAVQADPDLGGLPEISLSRGVQPLRPSHLRRRAP